MGLTLAACYGQRPTPEPIPTLSLQQGPAGSRCLVLLLPGRGDTPQDYLTHRFASLGAANGLAADLVAVDSHLGYFRNRTVVERLHRDVVAPAVADGAEPVWLAGISLGGMASLLYLREHAEAVDGALLLAPYLGEGAVLDEIEEAGGLLRWTPPATLAGEGEGGPRGDDVWRSLWKLIQRLVTDPAAPPLYLGYGEDDRLARSHRLLAAALPPERVVAVPGGHDWKVWRALWSRFTEGGVPACGPAAGSAAAESAAGSAAESFAAEARLVGDGAAAAAPSATVR